MTNSLNNPLGLNNFEIVQVIDANTSSSGSPTNWNSFTHSLGYAPIPFAYFNNVGQSPIFSNGNIPLPTFQALTVDTTNQQIIFRNFLYVAADSVNVYTILFNSTGAVISTLPIKIYLLRERIN